MARYFSKEEIDQIRVSLSVDSIHDSDLPETETLTGDDYVAVVQEGKNKKLNVNTFRSELQNGPQGESAYEVAVRHGYTGTEEEWLNDPINGIKGVGIKSIIQTGTSTQSLGNNTITVTYSDNSTSSFIVKNGAQGNSGYSGAAGELEVVNNLTDGGSTAALSAEMGKTLKGSVDSLDKTERDIENVIVGGKQYVTTETTINLSAGTVYDGWIQDYNNHAYYNPTAGRKFTVFSISDADSIKIVMAAGKTTKMAYMTSSTVTVNTNLPTCSGEDNVIEVASGENIFYIPSDCTYIALGTYVNEDISPESIKALKSTVTNGGEGILSEISSLNSEFEQLRDDLENREEIDLSDGTEYVGWIVTQSSKVFYNKTSFSSRKFVIVAMPSGKEKLDIVMPSSKTTKLAFLKSSTATADSYLDACQGETGVRDVLSGSNTYTIPSDCRYIAVGTLAASSVVPTSIEAYTKVDDLISDLQDAAETNLPKINSTILNSYGTTISKFDTEKLAHICNVAFVNGYFYIPYVADESNWQESYSLSTNFIRLAVVPLCDPTKTKWYDVAKVNDTIGGVTIGSSVTSPHDPTVAYKSGYVYIIFRASVNNKAVELCRRFNPSTMSLENSLTTLTLDGSDFDPVSVVSGYNTITQQSVSSIDPYSMDFNSRIVLASDGYYYGGVGGVGTGFHGIIIKSSDLLNWTTVAADHINSTTTSGEVNIAEMSSGLFLVAFRDQTKNTILLTWNSTSNTWSSPEEIDNSVRARPCPFEYNGETYVAMNVTGTNKNISGYGEAIRQNLGIYKVDSSLNLTDVSLLHRDCSIQYPALVVANENKLWMSFSTDTRHISAAQGRSNLELKEITFAI